jgi:hypothetical protein
MSIRHSLYTCECPRALRMPQTLHFTCHMSLYIIERKIHVERFLLCDQYSQLPQARHFRPKRRSLHNGGELATTRRSKSIVSCSPLSTKREARCRMPVRKNPPPQPVTCPKLKNQSPRGVRCGGLSAMRKRPGPDVRKCCCGKSVPVTRILLSDWKKAAHQRVARCALTRSW